MTDDWWFMTRSRICVEYIIVKYVFYLAKYAKISILIFILYNWDKTIIYLCVYLHVQCTCIT